MLSVKAACSSLIVKVSFSFSNSLIELKYLSIFLLNSLFAVSRVLLKSLFAFISSLDSAVSSLIVSFCSIIVALFFSFERFNLSTSLTSFSFSPVSLSSCDSIISLFASSIVISSILEAIGSKNLALYLASSDIIPLEIAATWLLIDSKLFSITVILSLKATATPDFSASSFIDKSSFIFS